MEIEKKGNGKKILLICIIICIIACLAGLGYWFYDNKLKNDNTQEKNTVVSLKDDFYDAVNYETLKNAKIPSDSGAWSKWYDAGKTIEKRVEQLTNEILEDPNFENKDVDAYIEVYTDYEGRDKRGFSELQPYFDMVDRANTIEEFNNVLITLNRDLDVYVLFNFESTVDFYDSSKTVFMLDPIVIEFPLDYYTEKDMAFYVPLSKQVLHKYCETLGYSSEKADNFVEQIIEFIKTIQEKSIATSKVTDSFVFYNKYTLDEITNEIKNIPIKQLLTELKINKEDYYLVADMGHYKALDEFYTLDNLPFLKELAKVQIVSKFFVDTTQENVKFLLEMSNKLFGRNTTMEENERQTLLGIKSSYISDELQKRYEELYFTEEDKKVVADLVADVKDYYKTVINNSDWLSNATKEEAIKKLDNMKVKIGYQGEDDDKDDIYHVVSKANGGTLISNLIGEYRFSFDNYYKSFNKEATLQNINTLQVNAFYRPLDNSINFLAGFKELYGNEKDYYKLLGYFGFVIGHEISHAFDTTGSKFDENGKVANWWTEEDKTNYDKYAAKIEDYYSKYEYMGLKVDGKLTLGENIADLGAMKAIVSIAESKGATNEDFKKMFEAYADLWVSKSTKEMAQLLITGDNHSPDKVRVNAVLSSTDKFYEVYGITEKDKMYVPKEERVGLW